MGDRGWMAAIAASSFGVIVQPHDDVLLWYLNFRHIVLVLGHAMEGWGHAWGG